MLKHEYNIFPEMVQDEFEQLCHDLNNHGYNPVMPVYLYQGKVLDGWNRMRACELLDIKPVFKEFTGTDSEAIIFVMQTNKRRNLTSSQWAALAAEADSLWQVLEADAKARQSCGQGGVLLREQIPEAKHERPRETIAQVFNTNDRYVQESKRLKRDNPEAFERVKAGLVTITEIKKEEKKADIESTRNRLAETGSTKDIEVDFRLGDFEEVLDNIPDGSVDCIITDPPYPAEYLNEWSKLSLFAARKLKQNGFCIAYSGQMHLPNVLMRLGKNLCYYWTFALYHGGASQIVNGVNLMCRWKPVLVFQNSLHRIKLKNVFQDYFISEAREKDGHNWQQSISGVSYLIEMFTNPGDLICDPFAGSGTTIKAALAKDRRIVAAEIDEKSYNIAKALL